MTTAGIFIALFIVFVFIRRAYNASCLEKVGVSLTMSATSATEGDELILKETVINQKWLPLPWLSVKFQIDRELEFADQSANAVSDLYYRHDLFHILMHQKITRRLRFTCTKRGFYAIRGLEVTAWDILMENKYIRNFETSTSLTVYPATIPLHETNELCTRVYGHLRTIYPIFPDPFSFRGIREYSPSDPMKNINFKASAKAQELMVNIQDFSNAREITLILDAERHPAWYNEYYEERAIKILASLTEKFQTQGVPLSFISNGKSIRSNAPIQIPEGKGAAHSIKILEALAYTTFETDSPITEALKKLDPTASTEYWLISPYHAKTTQSAYKTLRKNGARTAWIIAGDKPKDFPDDENIIFI
ncbi:MAG: DUF58 domain-containing protein [Defluviitaleaceae bacterium]|nr:DUF58 domain-containing protein [Defluviitaleaceae bacterium]